MNEVNTMTKTEESRFQARLSRHLDELRWLYLDTYVYQNTTYVPFRAVTEALRPDAQVAWERGQAVARAEDLSLSAQPGASYIEANGFSPGRTARPSGRRKSHHRYYWETPGSPPG